MVSFFISSALAQNAENCKLRPLAQIDVDVNEYRILIPAEINDHPIKMSFDTGMFRSNLVIASAKELGLPLFYEKLQVHGISGIANTYKTHIDKFRIFSQDARDVQFLVLDTDLDYDQTKMAGMVGQDLLNKYDIDVDTKNNKINLNDANNSCSGVYWSKIFLKLI